MPNSNRNPLFKDRVRFCEKINEIKDELSDLLKGAEFLKAHAVTEKERETAENLYLALDNAIDIASTEYHRW